MKKIFFLIIFATTFLSLFSGNIEVSAENNEEKADQKMEIKGIAFDQRIQTPIVLLTDENQNSILPIWIGLCEARSIEITLSDIVTPRPLTYDMLAAVIRTIGAKVERIVIVDLRDEVFYAQVEVSVNGKVSKIDARPSDAIALASRMNSPIYVKQTVLDKAALIESGKEKREL